MIQLTNPIWSKLNTLSPSRLNKYFSCGFRYQCEYIWGMKAPGGINLHRGSAIHKAIQADNESYIENRSRLGFDTLLGVAVEAFEKKIKKEGLFIQKSKEHQLDKIIDKARSEIEIAIRLYSDMEKPWIPVSVEENFTIDIGYPLPTNCYLDMVDEDNCIWDWKTSAKNSQIMAGIQNLFYSKAYEAKWNVQPSFKYCSFILTKQPYVNIQEIPPIEDFTILDRYVKAYLSGVENNVFLPASNSDYFCSEGGCPFYRACEYKNIK